MQKEKRKMKHRWLHLTTLSFNFICQDTLDHCVERLTRAVAYEAALGVRFDRKDDETRFFTLTRSVARGIIQGHGELVRLPGGSATQIIGQIQMVTLRGTLLLLLYCLIAAAVLFVAYGAKNFTFFILIESFLFVVIIIVRFSLYSYHAHEMRSFIRNLFNST